MNSILFTANGISILFLIVILFSLYLVPKAIFKLTREFRCCMWICIGGLVTEILAYFFSGKSVAALYITNYLGFFLINLLVIFYGFFFVKVICDYENDFMGKWGKKILIINSVLCGANVIFTTIGTINGQLFRIENVSYVEGPWDTYALILPGICFLIFFVLYFFKYKAFRLSNPFLIFLFLLVPAGAGVFMYWDPEIRHGFAGAALSLNVIYVLVLSKMNAENVAKEEYLNKLSKNDMLTGLKNRRGCQEVIDAVDKNSMVGVAFADVNGLKTVNDNQGHLEGDKLIVRAANLLKDSLEKGEVFRISGDEFVCIIKDVKNDEFEGIMGKVSDAIKANDRIMSLGFAIGEGEKIIETVKSAEQMMYCDKEQYYKETGKDRRKRS